MAFHPIRIVASLALTSALVAVAAGSGQASFPGANGRIFFTARVPNSGQPGHLYSVAADGSGLTQLTSGSGNDEAVAVDPNGGDLVVSRDTFESCGHLYWRQGVDLFTLNADGSAEQRLTNDCPIDEVTPAWSPSGRHLAVSRFGQIWTMRADGAEAAMLTCTGLDSDFAPTWSPDGRLIAFERVGDVYVMDADGRNARRVATGSRPSFAPDGAELAYAGTGSQQGIHVVALDGTHDVRLTTGTDGEPIWSPDGTQLAFAQGVTPGRWSLATMNRDGSQVRTIVDQLDVASLDWARVGAAPTVVEPDVTPAQAACAPVAAPTPPAPIASTAPAGVPPVHGPIAVDVSQVQPPDRLAVAGVVFRPTILRTRKPFALTLLIRDLGGRPVKGAVVRVTALNGATKPTGQVRTSSAGVASFRVTSTRQLRLRAGGRLVLAVHVRRPGAPWTGDVSALRLISVRSA